MRRLDIFKLHASLLGNHSSSGQQGNILHSSLSIISESGSLHSANLNSRPKLVDDESGKSLTFNVLGDNQKRRLALDDRFKERNKLLQTTDFLFNQQDQRIIQHTSLGLRISDKVGADETSLKFHSFDNFQFVLQGFSVLNSDDSFLSDAFHGIRNKLPNFFIGVGRNGTDLRNLFLRRNRATDFFQSCDDLVDGKSNTPAKIKRVQTSSYSLATFRVDGTSKDSSGGGTISSNIVSLRRDAFDQLCSHVLEFVFKVNRFGNSNTILRRPC
mmetsp:Transcript_5449/g.14935  ORF Transcript_5449/g.14935 Transcript_5449/m.14935 type:complete len:271 (-) Transcript_5449:8-820(-)